MKMWLWWEIMSLGIMCTTYLFVSASGSAFIRRPMVAPKNTEIIIENCQSWACDNFLTPRQRGNCSAFCDTIKIRQLFARRSPNGVAGFDTILNGYVTGENFRPKNRVRLVRLCGACPALEIVIREFILLKVYWMFVVYPISCDVDIFVRKKPNF